jgi:hypothetical protein
MTSLSKKPVAKKRGRPAGSKNKPAAKAKSFKQYDVAALQNKIAELEMIRERLHSVIDRQEYKAVQYQAVIDYLETKLELK